MPNLVCLGIIMKKRIIPLEIIASVLIIATIVFIITLISLEIKVYSQRINKKMEATLIASNILENIKTRSYDNIEKYISELSYVGISKKIENNIQYVTVFGNEFSEKIFGTQIPKDYIVELQSENYGNDFNVLKKISVIVEYEVNGKPENFSLSSIIERENIEECNSPVISEEYFKEFNITELEYDIVPIKYSEDIDKFVVTSKEDEEWYNYSVKRWAKVIAIPKKSKITINDFKNDDVTLKSAINYENETFYLTDYMYVWIPNFSVKDNVTYFRYSTGKKAIKNDFMYVDGKYLYLNKIGEEIKDISIECSFEGVLGVWKKFGNEQDIYYSNFNQTKYAPINIY